MPEKSAAAAVSRSRSRLTAPGKPVPRARSTRVRNVARAARLSTRPSMVAAANGRSASSRRGTCSNVSAAGSDSFGKSTQWRACSSACDHTAR